MINGSMSKQFGVALLFSFHVRLVRNLCRISQSVSRPREGLARASSMLKWLHSEYFGIQGTLLAILASRLIVRFKDNLWWTFAQAAWIMTPSWRCTSYNVDFTLTSSHRLWWQYDTAGRHSHSVDRFGSEATDNSVSGIEVDSLPCWLSCYKNLVNMIFDILWQYSLYSMYLTLESYRSSRPYWVSLYTTKQQPSGMHFPNWMLPPATS